jgi:hypothetical protein
MWSEDRLVDGGCVKLEVNRCRKPKIEKVRKFHKNLITDSAAFPTNFQLQISCLITNSTQPTRHTMPRRHEIIRE